MGMQLLTEKTQAEACGHLRKVLSEWAQALACGRRPRGIVRLYQDRRLLWERGNLVVTSGLVALASLAGGVTSGEFISVVGFGSGSTAPSMGDTGLSANPSYYNATGTVVVGPSGGVASGSVQIAYALGTTDYAANPLTITEIGFFGN